MRSKQSGFTLVEIAIVLVIIGLLLGGVLKGQELINSAKVKNFASDIRNISTFIYAYQDRFRALPGDDPRADTNLPGGTPGCCGQSRQCPDQRRLELGNHHRRVSPVLAACSSGGPCHRHSDSTCRQHPATPTTNAMPTAGVSASPAIPCSPAACGRRISGCACPAFKAASSASLTRPWTTVTRPPEPSGSQHRRQRPPALATGGDLPTGGFYATLSPVG
jgi:prepilin-type N-terminal cleavage/methylation domain-containing protein